MLPVLKYCSNACSSTVEKVCQQTKPQDIFFIGSRFHKTAILYIQICFPVIPDSFANYSIVDTVGKLALIGDCNLIAKMVYRPIFNVIITKQQDTGWKRRIYPKSVKMVQSLQISVRVGTYYFVTKAFQTIFAKVDIVSVLDKVIYSIGGRWIFKTSLPLISDTKNGSPLRSRERDLQQIYLSKTKKTSLAYLTHISALSLKSIQGMLITLKKLINRSSNYVQFPLVATYTAWTSA